jgi:hypothetical protein
MAGLNQEAEEDLNSALRNVKRQGNETIESGSCAVKVRIRSSSLM